MGGSGIGEARLNVSGVGLGGAGQHQAGRAGQEVQNTSWAGLHLTSIVTLSVCL
jgi:hypothetical protein